MEVRGSLSLFLFSSRRPHEGNRLPFVGRFDPRTKGRQDKRSCPGRLRNAGPEKKAPREVCPSPTLARIERVKTLLETGNATIGEIIGQAGFSGEKHLSTLFRKATGSTMSDWRRRHRRAPEE